jgi:exonuclease SbcC
MTPERLELNEFGPYTDPQTVDFDELQARQLFLIHGATGSGKSTLLDAICFALYGKTSGRERDGDEMRSDFATPEDPTEVTLDFRLGEERYRVRRRPQQTLAKKRGEGVTQKSEKAALYDRSNAEEIGTDGVPLADGKRDVDSSVERLLGLEHEQFRQVVVLPQGKFRTFLSAGSTEREEILKVLFETRRYERLQDVLKEMETEAEDDVRHLRRRKEDALGRHETEDTEELEEMLAETTSRLEETREEKEGLAETLEAAREDLQQAKSEQKILDELEAARRAVEELREKRGAHETRKGLLETAQRAAEVAPVKDDLETRREEKRAADEEAGAAKQAFEKAQEALRASKEALEEERERDARREELRQEKMRLEGLEEDIEQLETVKSELSELGGKREDLEEKEALAGKRELLAKEFEEAQALMEKAGELSQKQEAVEAAEAKLQETEEKRGAREKELQEAKEQLSELEERRREAYASVLAAGLSDGEPCPVCGSEEHPAPAEEAHDVPSEDEIESAREEKTQAREALDEAHSAVSDAQSTLAETRAQVESLKQNHPRLDEMTEAEIETKREEAESALAEAREAAEEANTLAQQIEEKEEQLAELEGDLEGLEEQLDDVESNIDGLASKEETIRGRLPEDVATLEALNEALDGTTEELASLEEALESAETAVQGAREERADKQRSALSRQLAAQRAAERLAEVQGRFKEALRENGFDDASDFEEARRDKEKRESMKEEVETFEEAWAAATDRNVRAEEQAEDIEEPDVGGAEETVDSLTDELDAVKEVVTKLEMKAEEIREALQTIEEIESELQEADERYRQVGFLSELARGGNESRMSLQRFVLATRLEEVLRVANEHIAHMTQNRYRLLRSEEVGDRRSGSGLDLLVHDAYTGDRRPVATLSGGEGFMAALSLALGLSDVVQSISGGRHLETLFIDEGFGSLDQEALDRAMQALSDLRDTGRLVGVISHVSELKQRISTRLEVHQTQEGSTLSMTV